MRKIALLGAILLGLAGTAQARGFPAGSALLHSTAFGRLADVAQPSCPAGVPVQTIAVVNQANVRPWALAKVERATTDQSMQVRSAWGTPCVRFGAGGWVLTLTAGAPIHNSDGSTSYATSGRHCGALGTNRWTCYSAEPTLSVDTAGLTYKIWARAFTHEIDETLIDPTDGVTWTHGLVEVCDPVQGVTYPVDGIQVSDFVFPSYFNAGASPWDEVGALSGFAYGL